MVSVPIFLCIQLILMLYNQLVIMIYRVEDQCLVFLDDFSNELMTTQ